MKSMHVLFQDMCDRMKEYHNVVVANMQEGSQAAVRFNFSA